MAGRSQCRHCRSALPTGANYCLDCGAPVSLMVLDPVGFEDPPMPAETEGARHQRWGLLAVSAVFIGLMVSLWGLTRDVDPPDVEPLSSATPEEGTVAADSTRVGATTASTTTAAPTTDSEQVFVNDVPGPVLGDDVNGVLVSISGLIMHKIDLSTGAVERIDLERPIYADGPHSGIVVSGNLIAVRGTSITITDLSDGSQRQQRDIPDGSFNMHVAGRAGVDSVWLATHPEPDQTSEAIEVDVGGEFRRRVEIPRPFSIEWAEGDELILEAVDGSWRYDTGTGVAVRMPGAVVAFEPGFVITASCDESLQCDVRLDRGSGPEVVDWLSASDVFDGLIELSPDLSGALLHVYAQGGAEYTFIDLHTGSRVDLGHLPIDPYRGVAWIEGSRWIIGQEDPGRDVLAIETETGSQVELELPRLSSSQSFLAIIPSN